MKLTGRGKSGKRWEAHLSALDQVWRGDLDRNGIQDYVFFGAGPYYNGRSTPTFSLSILLMDSDAMPVPFFTVVYQGENGDGIQHLVDLNHDGNAELLISTYDENPSDPHVGAFCSGHWVTQLFKFKDLGAEEVSGPVAGIAFPFIHAWSDGRKECGEFKSSVTPPTLYEHGTNTAGSVATTIRRKPDADGFSFIKPVAGCRTVRPVATVYDRARDREIAFPNPYSDYAAHLTDRIMSNGARVELRGIDKWMGKGACSVNLMWAQ